MNKKLIIIALVLIGISVGGFFIFSSGSQETETPSVTGGISGETFEKGKEAPDVTLTDFEGNMHDLSSFEGKVVILDFWAGWCPFCVEEMPILQETQDTYEDVKVIGVHRTDTESKRSGLKFAEDRGVSYLLVADTKGSLYEAAGGFGMPVAVYIDKEGVVAKVKSGPKTEDEIKNEIEDLLNK